MATAMTPAQMQAALDKWVLKLKLYPGWETRGYGPGSITDAEGVIIHHTGSDAQSDNYLHFLAIDGRPDVPAPLCNWATDMDGDLWLIAAERANHAGMGSSTTLGKITVGTNGYDWRNREIRPGPDDLNGNYRYYGNEVRFDGADPMTRDQWVTTVLSSAAVCDFHGWGAWRVIGHREHSSRKPDPGSTLMYMIRRDVDAALRAGPGKWPTQGADTMATMTDAQIAALLDSAKRSAEASEEVAQLFRTHAIRMGNLTNEQMPDLRATLKALLTQTGGDTAQVEAILAEIRNDVDRTADATAGPDS